MGHTAKYISEDRENGLEPAVREYYRGQAKEHFEKFYSLNSFNILREDELTASFALEYVDLLLLEEHVDREKIMRLIKTAVDMAGNANDILELCAVSYLKIGDTEEAEKLLRILVNEDYNSATNAKLLSRIYVSEFLNGSNPLAKTRYEILASRVTPVWLFPMPDYREEDLFLQDNDLQWQYLSDQRFDLQKEYRDAINQFIEKYIILFNRIIPVPVEDAPDEYFLNTPAALRRRRQDVYEALESDRGNEYRIAIRESGYRFRYVELINAMLSSLDSLRLFSNNPSKDYLILLIRKNLAIVSGELKVIQQKLNANGAFAITDYDKIQECYSFQHLTKEFFDGLKESIMEEIGKIESLDVLDNYEMDLIQFCREQDIPERSPNPNGIIRKSEVEDENAYITMDVLGRDEHDERSGRIVFNKMLSAVKEVSDSIIIDNSKVEFLVHGDQKFELYFKNVRLQGDALKSKTLAVIDDHSFADSDLFIMYDGVVQVKHNKIANLRDFDRIGYKGKAIYLGWPDEYSNRAVDLGQLYNLLEKIRSIRDNAKA